MTRQNIKSAIRKVVSWSFYHSGAHRICQKGRVLILTYHRILSVNETQRQYVQPGMYVLDEVFDKHLEFLQQDFQILSFPDLLERWEARVLDRNRRYCVITFDDGWLDNYLYAYPLLQKYQIPATIFLATDFIGTDEWFWPDKVSYLIERAVGSTVNRHKKSAFWFEMERVLGRNRLYHFSSHIMSDTVSNSLFDAIIEGCKELPHENILKLLANLASTLEIQMPKDRGLLNWSEVSQMSQNRISFGSHSCSHRILTKLSSHEVKRELEASSRALRARPINYVPVFCYPNGDCNRVIQNMVKECGYEAAVGVRSGCEGRVPANLFEVKRISIHNDITPTIPQFAFHLLGPHL